MAQTVSRQRANFVIAPEGTLEDRFPYFATHLQLTTTKPKGIKREPPYRAIPKYGILHLGNGPKSEYIMASDEPETGAWKIYIDRNQSGDLADDGDGSWTQKVRFPTRVRYGPIKVQLRASYGTATREMSSAEYSIELQRFTDLPYVTIRPLSTRVGTLTIDGKRHKALLEENDGDALFVKPVEESYGARTSHPIWLRVDMDDDGDFDSGSIDVRGPFKLGEETYELVVSVDGSHVSLNPTHKAPHAFTKTMPAILKLLKRGVEAPDFTIEKWGGGSFKLSDYRGKVVVLFFRPATEPSYEEPTALVEAVNKRIRGQDVSIIAICYGEDKRAFADWARRYQSKYTFQFCFEPVDKDKENSVLTKRYKINGPLVTYVIDKNGAVAAATNGYQKGRNVFLEEALKELSVHLK